GGEEVDHHHARAQVLIDQRRRALADDRIGRGSRRAQEQRNQGQAHRRSLAQPLASVYSTLHPRAVKCAMSALALALAGAVLWWVPAFRFRIDAATCPTWPTPTAGALYALAYVGAVALLTAGWLRALGRNWSLRRALAAGALVHALAIVAPPFASND